MVIMENLTKNQICNVIIDGYASDGSGICRIDGRAVFVKGALDGERCVIKILRVTASAAYARVEEILEPSPSRTLPECPVFGKCGGCDLMHMSYDEELRFKLGRVNDALARIGGLNLHLEDIIGAEHIHGYRNKAIFNVGSAGKGLSCGFYRKRSHDIVPVERCLIQPELSSRAANFVAKWCGENGIPAYDEKTGRGSLRHILVRCGFSSGQAQAVIVTARGFGAKTTELVSALRAACPELTGIMLCVNKRAGNTVLSGDFHLLWGSGTVTETLCGLSFELSPQSFFQINPPQAERLYNCALEYASPNGEATVLDLYCGTGTISLCLARGAKRVVGVEIVADAVENARKNALANGIQNAEFICADAARAGLAERGIFPTAVVVDPPRKGLSPEVIDIINEMNTNRIVYVSCDPATLARDLARFTGLGWEVTQGRAVDMFPRTANVETVVLLSRKTPNDVIYVDLELDEMDITAAEAKVTYQEIKDTVVERRCRRGAQTTPNGRTAAYTSAPQDRSDRSL